MYKGLRAYRGTSRKLGAIALLGLFALLFSFSLLFRETIYSVISSLASFIEGNKPGGTAAFVAVSAFSALISPLSSVVAVPSMVLVWGRLAAFWWLLAGWMIGSVAGYFIGRSAGRGIIGSFVSLRRIDKYADAIPSGARFWLVLLFRICVPTEIAVYALGMIRYDFRRYLLISFLAEAPLALALVYTGGALNEGDIRTFLLAVLLLSAMAAMAAIVLRKFLR